MIAKYRKPYIFHGVQSVKTPLICLHSAYKNNQGG